MEEEEEEEEEGEECKRTLGKCQSLIHMKVDCTRLSAVLRTMWNAGRAETNTMPLLASRGTAPSRRGWKSSCP
ncbi:unnamed protein product [Prorocentrum cordatum]|uniref:Uncharacterized protein n=1 Tax=Prorocentrum cordatum TaxID=2364126 RepID=A0ABN9R853_9DINO|nr:unnamed protein product [Polarella glacialis]